MIFWHDSVVNGAAPISCTPVCPAGRPSQLGCSRQASHFDKRAARRGTRPSSTATAGPVLRPNLPLGNRNENEDRAPHLPPPLQELFVEEMVAAVDAVGRNSISQVVRGLLGSLPATLTTSTVNAMGPLRSVLLPVPTPVELLSRCVCVWVTQAPGCFRQGGVDP